MPNLLCLLSFHRWTLQQVLDDKLAEILYGEIKGMRWQEVCSRPGCRATRPIQQQSGQTNKKGTSQ